MKDITYITVSPSGVITIPFFRLGVSAHAFPLFQLLEAVKKV